MSPGPAARHGRLSRKAVIAVQRAEPGAQCAIAVRSTHYESAGFAARLAADAASGVITEPDLVEVSLHAPGTPSRQHAGDTAFIVLCQILT